MIKFSDPCSESKGQLENHETGSAGEIIDNKTANINTKKWQSPLKPVVIGFIALKQQKLKVIVANNEAYNTIVGKYLDTVLNFYRPSCYFLHHATITFSFDFCFFSAVKPITTLFKGLCHFLY